MEIKTVPIEALSEDPANVRMHNEKNIKAIKASLKRFGQQTPIVVDGNLVVRAGNGRLRAAIELGWETIDVVQSDLPMSELTAFAIADNRTAELAEWDMDALQKQLAALDAEGISYDELGFEWPEDHDQNPNKGTAGLTDPDEVPEVTESIVKRGEIWQLGSHRLMCGDSTSKDDVERLMGGAKADMVFTDPPYGVDYDGGMKKREKLKNDELGTEIYAKVLPLYCAFTTERAAFYIWYADGHIAAAAAAAAAAGVHIASQIIWVKNHAQFMSNARYKGKHEPCMYGYKRGKGCDWFGPNNEVTVWEVNRSSKNEFHPTQKPVDLPVRAISNSSPAGGLVVDWFSGSGSTLIACEKTGRTCYGMEIDPHYCDVIIKRWEDFTGRKAERAAR